MPNWCNNFIEISGTKSDMLPIYEFFNDGKTKLEEHYKKKNLYIQDHPGVSPFDEIEGITKPDILVMNSLYPHNEEYNMIKETGQYLVHPQQGFYGTKWDFNMEDVNFQQLEEDIISFSVPTAWSPPDKFCEKLTGKHNISITITYDEPGCNFAGKETFTGGEMVEQEFYDNWDEGMYHFDNGYFWESLTDKLDDLEEGVTLEDLLKEYHFLSELDKIELTNLYKQAIDGKEIES